MERNISKRDLQAAIKNGIKKRTGRGYSYTFADVDYITDITSTKEITSWALSLPLEKFELNESEKQEIIAQKERVQSGKTKITSHTVLVIDQSSSMNLADVHGHRSRSRGAYYAIANEMIAVPLVKDHVSFTDVVTVIEMGDEAKLNPEIVMEPVTMALYNKIVDLAD